MNFLPTTLYLALFATLVIQTSATAAPDQSITFRYSGTITNVFRDEIGFGVPVGESASIEFTFDPDTPDSQPGSDKIADYLFSGGETRLQARIGDHVSTVATEYRITVIADNCNCATQDQYNLLSFESQGRLVEIDFPGYLEDVEVQLYFREGNPPVATDALFTSPPSPRAFGSAALRFVKRAPSGGSELSFRVRLDPGEFIPEPSSAVLLFVAACTLMSGDRVFYG